MIIPIEQLPKETLFAIIENYILREGTEYGEHDVDLSVKIAQVHQQLQQGSAVLVYSELHETVNIMAKEELNQTQ